MSLPNRCFARTSAVLVAAAALLAGGFVRQAEARPEYRQAFFEVYPDAEGTTIDTVSSMPLHCGVCHYRFIGGLTRNPYGVRLQSALNTHPLTPEGRREAVISVENEDPDGDGFPSVVEITQLSPYDNTPCFPGLNADNVNQTTDVSIFQIQGHVVPQSGGDTTPPAVTVITPNGGETVTGNTGATVQWSVSDASPIHAVDLFLSVDNGATFLPLYLDLPDTGSYTWYPPNRPTAQARFRVEATDTAHNTGGDNSNAVFTVQSPAGGLVPTTHRDFDLPGSQPHDAGTLDDVDYCAACHGNFDPAVESHFNWQGSMKAHASRDLIFAAAMVVANQDAPDSGDLCLRCHNPKGWLEGRSVPTDGSAMTAEDRVGVFCDYCHRMVDPIYQVGNPAEDLDVLAGLDAVPDTFANAMAVLDSQNEKRRGPFTDADISHPILASPFHREAALCGVCHDVSNPVFENDGSGNYLPNAYDTPAPDLSAGELMPMERTYSEWYFSDYNTPGGVYAPQFGGNLDYVSVCQDCHMRDVTGFSAGILAGNPPPERTDLPLHDMTGGSTWLPDLLDDLYPGEVDAAALQAGIVRAQYMLQNAATVTLVQNGPNLDVTVTNQAGHKLPTGYPEGRRIWINVRFLDDGMALISESAAYDPATGTLTLDPEAKVYEMKPGLDDVTAPIAGEDPGPSFHFVLNNKVWTDNRIPPLGFTNTDYAGFGGAPVGAVYADGQNWDTTAYAIPAGAVSAEVTLFYQSLSREFVAFLRDENTTDTKGEELYDLWDNNGKCPPEVMWTGSIALDEAKTVSADLACTPGAGTLPFVSTIWIKLANNYNGFARVAAARLNVDLANGSTVSSWKAGYTTIAPGATFLKYWNQNFPSFGAVVGTNTFTLVSEDVTPSPYNQPPYPPSGDTDTVSCTVVGNLP